jgi:predicted N-acyltransferase
VTEKYDAVLQTALSESPPPPAFPQVKEQGWLPQHVLVRHADTNELLGVCPMYLKSHSYGEYVFDHSWANAYMRFSMSNYYPKLQSCVPFTPVTGNRLLAKPGRWQGAVRGAIATALKQVTEEKHDE